LKSFALFIEEKEPKRQLLRILSLKKTKNHLINNLHVSQRFGFELSRWILRVFLEHRDSSKSDDKLTDATVDDVHLRLCQPVESRAPLKIGVGAIAIS